MVELEAFLCVYLKLKLMTTQTTSDPLIRFVHLTHRGRCYKQLTVVSYSRNKTISYSSHFSYLVVYFWHLFKTKNVIQFVN